MTTLDAIVQKLTSILSSDAIADGLPRHARAGLGPAVPIVQPPSSELLAEVMACAHREGWRVLPAGRGSKLDWGALPRPVDLVVSTARLDRLIEHAAGDLTVTAEAGIGFAHLQAQLAAAHQFLALDPVYPEAASLGGVLSTADSGPLRHRYGGVRDMCLGVRFVRSDGVIAHAGGRVVKNVAGYDLMKLLTGAFGTLGIVVEATFRLHPLPPLYETTVIEGPAEQIASIANALLASPLSPVAVEVLNEAKTVVLAVRFAAVEASIREQSARLAALASGLAVRQLGTEPERAFWSELAGRFWQSDPGAAAVCRLGVRPASAIPALSEARRLGAAAVLRAGSGVGVARFDAPEPARIVALRDFCRRQGGYLIVLEAPAALKAALDPWGYSGSALGLMRRVREQFDPGGLLAPGRLPF